MKQKIKHGPIMMLIGAVSTGAILGGYATSKVMTRPDSGPGELAAARAMEASQLLLDNQGNLYASDEVYQNALHAMRRRTVELGLSFSMIQDPALAAKLRELYRKMAEHPELDAAPEEIGARDALDSVQTANAVRACIVKEQLSTTAQVSDCAVEAVRNARTTPTPAKATSVAPIPLVNVK